MNKSIAHRIQNLLQHAAISGRTGSVYIGAVFLTMNLHTAVAESTKNQAVESGQEQITKAVYAFIESHYSHATDTLRSNEQRAEIDVTWLDPRLAILPCSRPLEARLNQNQTPVGKITVRVDCNDTAPWTRYIPATVRVFQQVAQTTRPLARGTIVGRSDVQMAETDISTLRNTWLGTLDPAIGKEVRRALPAGAAVTVEALVEPQIIARGETVVLTAQRGSAIIKHQGVALESGELGRQINIRNASSDRVVRAIVTGPGQAEVVF